MAPRALRAALLAVLLPGSLPAALTADGSTLCARCVAARHTYCCAHCSLPLFPPPHTPHDRPAVSPRSLLEQHSSAVTVQVRACVCAHIARPRPLSLHCRGFPPLSAASPGTCRQPVAASTQRRPPPRRWPPRCRRCCCNFVAGGCPCAPPSRLAPGRT